jgi:hypothetical protein
MIVIGILARAIVREFDLRELDYLVAGFSRIGGGGLGKRARPSEEVVERAILLDEEDDVSDLAGKNRRAPRTRRVP